MTSGILPDHAIRDLVATGAITARGGFASFDDPRIQPASLDLSLSTRAYRVRSSFLPGAERRVAERVDDLRFHELNLLQGAVLETGCVYIVEMRERFRLPEGVAANANPKSSTGRLDVFTRLIADRAERFDELPEGYDGPVFLEISPKTFPIIVREGSRLAQIRFRVGDARLGDEELRRVDAETPLVDGAAVIRDGLVLTADLKGRGGGPVGYRAKRHTGVIDIDKAGACAPADFWEPIAGGSGELVLDPGEFYILASREAVSVPPGYAAEMAAIDPLLGEFRVHYAGFFDPGFGHAPAGGAGSRAVLEVRSHDVPFMLGHGQIVGRLAFERMASTPERLYGMGRASNYQAQGLKLSKHFRPW